MTSPPRRSGPLAWEYDTRRHLARRDHREGLGARADEQPSARPSTAAPASATLTARSSKRRSPGGVRGSEPRCLATASRPRRSSLPPPTSSRRSTWAGFAEAPLLASFCLTEPDAGSDVKRDEDQRGAPAATSGSSTAPSASSPTVSTPTTTRSTPRPTRKPATAGSPASSFRVTPASSSTSTRTRWASAPPTRRRSPSTTSRSRSTTWSARRTRASRSR